MAFGDTLAAWASRPDWSGEFDASNAVLLQRFDALAGSGATRTLVDAANPAREWTLRNANAATAALAAGRWGTSLSLNRNAPATEQTSLTVANFAGLWPASGKLLFKAWAALTFSMGFTPIISSRNTSGKTPLVYLSTQSDGRPRAQVYSATGSLLIDQSEPIASIGWTPAALDWVCYLWIVDMDAHTSQLAMVRRDTGQSFIGPVRPLSGAPNPACEAAFEVATLTPTAAYWAGGYIDEIGYWQPTAVDMAAVVADVVRSLPARGRDSVDGAGLTVTDELVLADSNATLHTGVRPATWAYQPTVDVQPLPLSAHPRAILSSDGGATWGSPLVPASLPAAFNGLARWEVPLAAGESLTSLRLLENTPPPELDGGVAAGAQNQTLQIGLSGAWEAPATFQLASGPLPVTFDGSTMRVDTGWAAGVFKLYVTVTDASGRTSAPAEFVITVEPPSYEPPPNPVFARAPIIVHEPGGGRAHIIADPLDAVLTKEVNGEHNLVFLLPVSHRRRSSIAPERVVEVSGELFRVRRIKDYRERGLPLTEVYCEARFYDLRMAGQVEATEWGGTQAGQEMARVLAGTGWTVGVVNVSTVRTWSMEEGSPLACLRQIADVHGGDLVFDNAAKTVSLLVQSGKDNGLSFLYGRGTRDAKRVEDTTTLATRITPRNAEGVGIAEVNGGVPYLEDYTWTTELREAVYDFKSGTNPYTMLAMAQAAIGKRAKPSYSYEVDVIDSSAWSGQEIDRFDAGDRVLVNDQELGITVSARMIRMEYNLTRPWASKVVLDQKLRELGSGSGTDAGVLSTGSDIDTRDVVPFNLLYNARFDNGLAHWAASGATVADGGVTGRKHVELAGGGVRWIEQTFAPDTRDVYTISLQLGTDGFPQGEIPLVEVVAEVTYDDGSTETIVQQVS